MAAHGWRYGFLAVKKDGVRVYGKVFVDADGSADFKVPINTEHLWLVVSGAPKEYQELSDKDQSYEQWPYQIKLSGTSLHASVIK